MFYLCPSFAITSNLSVELCNTERPSQQQLSSCFSYYKLRHEICHRNSITVVVFLCLTVMAVDFTIILIFCHTVFVYSKALLRINADPSLFSEKYVTYSNVYVQCTFWRTYM